MKSNSNKKTSIFRSLFVPLFLLMLLQGGIFYFAALYGGIEESLTQNAADILTERLINRKNDIETQFNKSWANLSECNTQLTELYSSYEKTYGKQPFVENTQLQVQFLDNASDTLVSTLRHNEVNGIFLILNDQPDASISASGFPAKKYGLSIRDLDPRSNYTGRGDLLLEKAPSSLVSRIGCSLDSWWEAYYSFSSEDDARYYYNPLKAAWDNPNVESDYLSYFDGIHRMSSSDQNVVSYSIPLIAADGYPYAVLGIEMTEKYLETLLPAKELHSADTSCYILALQDVNTSECVPMVTAGSIYKRCFDNNTVITSSNTAAGGGFTVTGRGDTILYGNTAPIDIYSNNNPFEDQQLTLIALVEENALFSYIGHIRNTLQLVSLLSLLLGVAGILFLSRRFAAPITALAKRVRTLKPQQGFHQLDRLGITEIDQLVESIETLNHNVSKDIARTEFFSRMSHDMRTPMNAIISFSSPELLEGADEELKDSYLEKIHTSGEYLLGLINEVLDMTKIESNKTELHYEAVAPTKLWDTTIPIIEKLSQKKNIHFYKEFTTVTDSYLMADNQHLNQIVINLLSNAVKFTPDGGSVFLTIHETLTDDPERINCNIVVRDTGIGMSEEFMNNLYTPFEREHDTQEGTGLGLSIAKKLVELMGGTIECDSVLGKGTTFTLNLPLKKCEAPQNDKTASTETAEVTATAVPAKPADLSSLHGKSILVCEDHPLNTQIICRLLERAGIKVTVAANGREGLDTFASSTPGTYQAILMDIRMPVMDGLTASTEIRKLDHPDATSIPIIAMTANAFREDIQATQSAGMNAHLSKPVEPDKLYETLLSFLS